MVVAPKNIHPFNLDKITIGNNMSVKLLVVEDDNCCSEIYQKCLEYEEDCDIQTSEDPENTLESLIKKEFDVVVSDLEMPHMNGFVFLSQVAPGYPHTVRIIISKND